MINPLGSFRTIVLGMAVTTLSTASILAQEVQWRTDYAAARQEARNAGRPLIVDFGTENCFWCQKLAATTLRDPAVTGLLNERFIPLRLDVQENDVLAQSLGIQSYPTMLLVAPGGKILTRLVGYVDADRLQEQIRLTLAGLDREDQMERAHREVAEAPAGPGPVPAARPLRSLSADDRDRAVPAKDFQAAQARRPTRGRDQDGLVQEAGASEMDDASAPGTVADESRIDPRRRVRGARELLARAREDYQSGRYLACMDHCSALATYYAGRPEAAAALHLAAKIEAKPHWMEQACEDLGELYLALAETQLREGHSEQAAACLERVIQGSPGTRQAKVARERLEQIKVQLTRLTEIKKQERFAAQP